MSLPRFGLRMASCFSQKSEHTLAGAARRWRSLLPSPAPRARGTSQLASSFPGHAMPAPLCTHALSAGVQSPHFYDTLVYRPRCSLGAVHPLDGLSSPLFLHLFCRSQMNPFLFVCRFLTVCNFLARVFSFVYNDRIVIFRRAEVLSTFAITGSPSVVRPHMHPFSMSVHRSDLVSAGNVLLFPQCECYSLAWQGYTFEFQRNSACIFNIARKVCLQSDGSWCNAKY